MHKSSYFLLQSFKCLEQHILFKHTTEKPFKCDKCDFSHASKMGLTGHVRACHSEQSNHVCHLCGFTTYSARPLKVHIESKHEKKKNFFCTQCDASFYYKVKFQEHVSSKYLFLITKVSKWNVCIFLFPNNKIHQSLSDKQQHYQPVASSWNGW